MSTGLDESTSKKPKKYSVFGGIQMVTTLGATALMLRCFNRFISHAQRGRAIVGCACCLYLSLANELGRFPFSFAVAGKLSTKNNEALANNEATGT